MATDFSFSFDKSQFGSTKEMERKLLRAVYGVTTYWDGRCEAYMKKNAPWKDRTTNARNGLFARAAKLSKTTFAIILGHSVTYGIYLELGTRHMDAKPIIVPTMEEFGPKVVKTLSKILDRLR